MESTQTHLFTCDGCREVISKITNASVIRPISGNPGLHLHVCSKECEDKVNGVLAFISNVFSVVLPPNETISMTTREDTSVMPSRDKIRELCQKCNRYFGRDVFDSEMYGMKTGFYITLSTWMP